MSSRLHKYLRDGSYNFIVQHGYYNMFKITHDNNFVLGYSHLVACRHDKFVRFVAKYMSIESLKNNIFLSGLYNHSRVYLYLIAKYFTIDDSYTSSILTSLIESRKIDLIKLALKLGYRPKINNITYLIAKGDIQLLKILLRYSLSIINIMKFDLTYTHNWLPMKIAISYNIQSITNILTIKLTTKKYLKCIHYMLCTVEPTDTQSIGRLYNAIINGYFDY
jgi:hypothetical protein